MRLLPASGLWAHPEFMSFWAAQAISAVGSRLTRTVLPILAITSLGASPGEVAWLAALGVAPAFLVGLLAGGFVDRRHKIPVLVGTDLLRAALLLTIPLAAWYATVSMPHLYLVAALTGAATALFQMADNAFLPALLGRERLVEANARIEATDAVAEIGGSALAGILVRVLSAPVVILLDALSYLWSAALLARIRARETPAPPSEEIGTLARLREDLRIGFRHAGLDPRVGPTLLANGLQTFFGGFLFALYMVFTLRTLALDEATVGIVIGVGGIGALLGSLVARRAETWLGFGPALLGTMLAGQAVNLLIPAAAHVAGHAVTLLVLHQLLGDALMVAAFILMVSLRQTLLPTEVLGRVNACFQVATGALLPLGTLVGGLLAERLGIETALWIGMIGSLAAPLALARPALLRLRRLETTDPAEAQAGA